jgi:stalled ribosome rescue protein Dom34
VSGDVYHLVVWIDHRVAHLYSVTREGLDEVATIYAPAVGRGHVHHKAGSPGPGHVEMSRSFLEEVARAFGNAREVLIVGPADAKTILKNYIDDEMPSSAHLVRGLEPMGHPDKGEIHTFATRFFRQQDLMGSAGD